MWVAFALQKLLTFFQQKNQHICVSLIVNFNESLTNDVVSFEQLGPGVGLTTSTATVGGAPVFLFHRRREINDFFSTNQTAAKRINVNEINYYSMDKVRS